VNASEELFSQRYDDAPWTPHVAQPAHVLVLGHFAEEFGEVGAQTSDSVLDAFDERSELPLHGVLRSSPGLRGHALRCASWHHTYRWEWFDPL
jgi:hypothetical protein